MSWVLQLSVWERSNTNRLFRMDAAVAQCMMASSLEGAGEILCSTSDTQLVCSCGMYSLLTFSCTSLAVVSPSASVAAMRQLFSQNTLQHDTTVLPAVHSTITPEPSQIPPLHPISCLIWLVDYSQHETQCLVLRHIQNSTAGLLCYFSLAPSVVLLQPCSLYCWLLGHLSPPTNAVLAPHCTGVWSWGVPSCLMPKLCFLFWPELLSLGCVKGCRCAGYCVTDSSQSVRSSTSWDAKEGPVMMWETAEAALPTMLCHAEVSSGRTVNASLQQ